MLLDLLRTDELRALAAILFDGQTQKEYAMQVGKSREWVKRRIHRASKKLSTAGVIITLPGKGRRARQRTHFVEPAAMNELAIDPERHGGWVRGTWITERRRGKLADRE